MTTNQSTNRKKQKQLTQTKHHHTLTLKTNIQHNPKMMMKTKTRDPQFKKLQQNQTKNKQETNDQARITKKILQTNITTRKARTNATKPEYKIGNPTPTLDNNNFPQLPKQTEKEDDQQQQKTTDNQKLKCHCKLWSYQKLDQKICQTSRPYQKQTLKQCHKRKHQKFCHHQL